MTSLLHEYYDMVLKALKIRYPYVQNETNVKKALIAVREHEGIEGDFSKEYAEIDELYREPTEEEIADDERMMKELIKQFGTEDLIKHLDILDITDKDNLTGEN